MKYRHPQTVKLGALFTVLLVCVACVKDPYRAAIQGSDDVSQAVHAAITVTGQYYSNGVFNDSQKATVGQYLDVVTGCNQTFRAAVVNVHKAGQTGVQAFLPIADTFVGCVRALGPHGNDPKIAAVLQAVDAAIMGVETVLNQIKGAPTVIAPATTGGK